MRLSGGELKESLKAVLRPTPLWPIARWARNTWRRKPWRAVGVSTLAHEAWLAPGIQIRSRLRDQRDRRDPQSAARRLFDPAFYLASNPDVAREGLDPFQHYLRSGARESRQPNPIFDVAGYVYDNPDVEAHSGNPLLHYVSVGRRRGATPHPLFDAKWYARHHPAVRRSRMDPYEHFLAVGRRQGYAASAAVDPDTDLTQARIVLPKAEHEAVTIIVPAYRSYSHTYRTLYAVSRRTPESLAIRVILADDCPEHRLRPVLGEVSGLEIVENPENLGFLMNCNHAATLANGEFIVFLNNDTVVQAGWLDALVRLAREDPEIGIVGSMLLNEDGSLQEAGNVMFKDGDGYPYGRGDRASRPEYGFVREVDAVTGACLLVRRAVFEGVGRFNEAYRPAFFEEYDLAFSVAAAGYKVVYQPASRVVHAGSASYGVEVRDRQTAVNRARFRATWASALASRYDGPQDLFLARDRRRTRGTILVVDDKVPEPDRNAGGLYVAQILRLLVSSGCKVIYLPADGCAGEPYTTALQQQGIEVLYGGINVRRWLARNGRHLDWVLLARPLVARDYLDLIRSRTRARLLYYTHDLHFLRELRRHQMTGDPAALRDSRYLQTIETHIFRTVDCVLTPSTDEVAVIQELAPGQEVRVLPPAFVESHAAQPELAATELARRNAVIFVGGYDHLPNVDAAQVLVREVMPLVWREVPSATLLLLGNRPPPEVEALAGDRVQVVGYVPDLAPWYAKARMSVSALRFGSGVKGKIISSLEAGVPVVTTSIGNEGIALEPGVEALIADQPDEIAAAVVRLFTDDGLLEALSIVGRRALFERFSEDRTRDALLAALRLGPVEASST